MLRFRPILLVASSLAFLLTIAGCGQFFPGANTITALQIAPQNAVVQPGVTQQYTATATYGDNTTADVSSSVTWSSLNTTVATIDSTGLLTGVSLGVATVQAKSGSVIGSTGVTVANKTVTSLTISPTMQTLSLASVPTVQFTATATYSDSSTGNVTTTCTWTSSASSIVSISNTSPNNGLAAALTTGTASITATAGGVTSIASTVTVGP